MSELVSSPKALCWGRVFRHLFPLSREVCNGCPADPEGRITSDDTYKLRTDPEIKLPAAPPAPRLGRNMGSFNEMIISRPSTGPCSTEEVAVIAEKAYQNNIGAFVVPSRLADEIVYNGILLNYEEFYYAVVHCPYLFAKGVVCIFDGDTAIIRRADRADNGQIVVALVDNEEATLKVLQRKTGNEVWLLPCNKEYEPIKLTADRLKIQGILYGIVRKYN